MGEKVGHVMCEVNRGQRGVSNYGETDCEETDMCLCLLVKKKRKKEEEKKEKWCGHVQKHNWAWSNASTQNSEGLSKNPLMSYTSMSTHANVHNTRPHGWMDPMDWPKVWHVWTDILSLNSFSFEWRQSALDYMQKLDPSSVQCCCFFQL